MENTSIIVALIAVLTGATALGLILGVLRFVRKPAEDDLFEQKLDELRRSETESEKKSVTGNSWSDYWYQIYRKTGRTGDPSTPGKIAIFMLILGVGIGVLVWPGDVIGGLGLGIGFLVFMKLYFGYESGKRSGTLEKQLPLLLSSMRANLQANATPQQAIMAVAEEIPSPLGDELKIVKADLNVNVTLENALRALADRVQSREIKFLVSSIEIAVTSGSDLDPQLATIQGIVTQRQRIAQRLASAVASVQPSIWVSGIFIPGGFAASYYTSPENQAFWTSFFGLVSLGICAVLYAIGLFITQRLVKGVENT